MGATDPIVLTHLFAADAAAAGLVDIAQLDAQLALLVAGHADHNDLWESILRGDLTLKDGLIRARMLHPEVVGLLQLVAQSTEAGLHIIPAARVASTGNLTLSGTQTIDGRACIAGDDVLVKDQTDPSENGLWRMAAGAWSRTPDAAAWDELADGFVWVNSGSANALSAWAVDIDDGGTIDVDPVAFQLVYRAAAAMTDMDPTAVATATPTLLDYVFIHDVSAGFIRRALMSALPFLASTTAHDDLPTRGNNAAHPQYLLKAGDTLTGDIDADGHKLTGLPTPTVASDAAPKSYVDAQAATASARRPGDVFIHAGSTCPADAFVCNGDMVVRADETDLFAAIGVLYGAGDGVTTFQLPDARGRAIIGAGTGGGLTVRAVADSGGEEGHILVLNEIPAHHHAEKSSGSSGTGADGSGGSVGEYNRNTGDSGGGLVHNNMQPFLAMLVCIQR